MQCGGSEIQSNQCQYFLIALMARSQGESVSNNNEKCKQIPLNLYLNFMLKEKPKRPTSSVSGHVWKLHHVKRFCPQLVRKKIFVCGQDSLANLLQETARGYVCGLQCHFHETVTMNGHVLRTELCCMKKHRVKWASSSILGSKYTVNCRWDKLYFYHSAAL